MKRGLLGLGFIAIMLISFVSAQFGYGFSLSDFLYSVDSSSLILLLLFIVFFTILNNIIFITFFKGNKTVSALVSFSISTMAVWGINRMQWNLGNFFFRFGLNEDTLYTIVLIVLLVLFIYLAFKKRLRYLFLGLGLLLMGLAAFTDFFFEWFTAFIIGVVLVILWWIGSRRAKKKNQAYYGGPGYDEPKKGLFRRGAKYVSSEQRLERKIDRVDRKQKSIDVKDQLKYMGRKEQKKRKEQASNLKKGLGALEEEKSTLQKTYRAASSLDQQKSIQNRLNQVQREIRDLRDNLSRL